MKLWPSGCNLKALRATDLSESGKRINRCHIIARSSRINHFLNRAVPTLFWATADICSCSAQEIDQDCDRDGKGADMLSKCGSAGQ